MFPNTFEIAGVPDIQFAQVDAFAEHAFGGNPAVVCKPGYPLDSELMQQIAREMNVSETCFLVPDDDGFGLRWFTPKTEVDLCGHATLAAAHCLWTEWECTSSAIQFDTLSGVLTARRRDGCIWLDFPSEAAEETVMPDKLAAAVTGHIKSVARNRLDYLIELESEDEVRSFRPDLRILGTLSFRGLIVTARAEKEGADFVSRYFAPYFGIDEDPVTGSTHCALGPYWRERLGKDELIGYQASDRGGWVRVRVLDNRVEIGGMAVTVMRGTLSV